MEEFCDSSTPTSSIQPLRCQKCRFHVVHFSDVVDSHGNPISMTSTSTPGTSCSSEVWYIPEDKLPVWMKSKVESGDWVKGKMNCPKCSSRIGSYNFVSGMKCCCGSHVLPSIHIVKSKVDLLIPPANIMIPQLLISES